MKKKENIALILSGGKGNRFENNLPKQFAEVFGKSILEYCIANYNKHNEIDKILIVSNPEFIDRTKQIAGVNKFEKVCGVIEGGKTRGESSYLGIKYLKTKLNTENANILIQDAVRPFTSDSIISNVIFELELCRAVSVVIPATDTIYVTDGKGVLTSIPKRECLFQAQTPQAFDLDLIYNAYENSERVSRFSYSDDCSILKNIYPTEEIRLIQGNTNNIKITYSEDLETFRQLLQRKKIK